MNYEFIDCNSVNHIVLNIDYIREAAKKVLFLAARPRWPLAPPPFGLVAFGTFSLH